MEQETPPLPQTIVAAAVVAVVVPAVQAVPVLRCKMRGMRGPLKSKRSLGLQLAMGVWTILSMDGDAAAAAWGALTADDAVVLV